MIGKTLAGVVAGFTLSAAAIALLHALPGGQAWLVTLLLAFFPLWTACMIGAFFFRTGLRAWLAFGSANLVVFGTLWLLRHGSGA